MLNRIGVFDFPFYCVDKIEGHDEANKYIFEILRQEKNTDPKGRNISNRGGYQTGHIWEHELFYKFANIISPYILKLKEEIKLKDGHVLELDGGWINENKGFNFNVPHLHPGCHFACVYYAKFPKNSGSIFFNNPVVPAAMTSLDVASDCGHFRNDFDIIPQTGTLLMFPSYFQHCVLQGDNISERITCAFNLTVKKVENESN